MAKIIDIKSEEVFIGMEDKSIEKVWKSELNFEPQVGDEVEVYKNDNITIVVKAEKDKKTSNSEASSYSQDENKRAGEISNKKKVDKVGYVLLAIFLGGFGVHKFYSGKTATGIIYLLLCWTGVPSLIGFVEGIIGIFQQADEKGEIYI